MNSTTTLPGLFALILPRIPFLLVCLAGIVIGLMQLSSNRKPALLVLAASGLLGLSFVTSLGMSLLSLRNAQSGGNHAELAATLALLGIVQGLFSAAGYGTLIGAAFVGRTPTPVPPM